MFRVRNSMVLMSTGFIAVLLLSSCAGYKSPTMTVSGVGAPTIAQLVPNSAPSGSGPFTMTINGDGFGTDAVVFWNGSVLSTMYVTTKQLMVAVPAADVANKETVPVYVRTAMVNSNTVDFTVN